LLEVQENSMRVLIGNTVKTGVADHHCTTREEAEALFMALHERREAARSAAAEQEVMKARKTRQPAKRGRSK
jgi:hypothetical protein